MGKELPSDWNSRRKKVLKRDNYECQNCGRMGGSKGNAELHAHHIVPRHSQGSHNKSNIKTFCSQCHKAIHHEDIDAPTGDQSWSEIYKRFASENTCPICRQQALNTPSDIVLADLDNFLEYDWWPREYALPETTGLIRCSNCHTAFDLTHKDGHGTVKGDEDLILEQVNYSDGSSLAYYAISIGIGLSFLSPLLTGSVGTYATLGIWLLLTGAIYSDTKYVRKNTTQNPDSRVWVLAPILGALHWLLLPLVGMGYLAYRFDKDASESGLHQNNLRNRAIGDYSLNDCPSCRSKGTLKFESKIPPQTVECKQCNARLKKDWKNIGLVSRWTMVDGNPKLVGETRRINEWNEMSDTE